MKNLIGSIALILLTACGGKGGGAAAPVAHVPDTTPHAYQYLVSDVYSGGDGVPNPVDIHQVCDFNLPGLIDNNSLVYFADPSGNYPGGISASTQGGGACGKEVSNYTVTFTNNGIDKLAVIIQVDGAVVTPDINGATHVLQPGETYTFQRGF